MNLLPFPSMTTTARTCPQCGSMLPPDAPENLCPECLMLAAFPTQAGAMPPPIPRRALPSAGEAFGGYDILGVLGRGGMGAVYEALHRETGRLVALKVLSHQLDNPEARARFLREGRLAASINHPNSVYVFGTEEIDGTPVISMELVRGSTLQERLQRAGPLSAGEAVDAILQVMAGLEAAQAIGILHRDIKPANCFQDTYGLVKVGDFGLSISTTARDHSLTLDGGFLGTPAFASPEQLRGEDLNLRSDIYAVGVTLFYLLTGRTPFEGVQLVQLISSVLERPAPSARQLRPEVPAGLAAVIQRCLAKQAGDRFANYEELRRALLPYASNAPVPASLARRFAAGLVDSQIELLLSTICLLMLGLGHWTAHLVAAGEILGYSFMEGLWGASPGKAMAGICVRGPDGGVPGFWRALVRTACLKLPLLLWTLLLQATGWDVSMMRNVTNQGLLTMWTMTGVQALFIFGPFLTARRSNGLAALHDLLSGTRVVLKADHGGRPRLESEGAVSADLEQAALIGPFHLLAHLASRPGLDLWLGYDSRLLRKVWILRLPPGSPPVGHPLRSLARAGRLRWLQGHRSPDQAWDAYEALSGQPLTAFISRPQPWAAVRHWLHDLAVELEAAAADGSLPGELSADRVWITADGRAKLLDFPAPGVEPTHPVLACAEPREFLNQAALLALEGRLVPADKVATVAVKVPLPLSAHQVLASLKLPAPTHPKTSARLEMLLRARPEITLAHRVLVPLIFCLVLVVMTATGAFLRTMEARHAARHPDGMALWHCMLTYASLADGVPHAKTSAHANDAAKRQALEIYMARRFAGFRFVPVDADDFYGRMVSLPEMEARFRKAVSGHPHVTPEQFQKAKTTLRSMLDDKGEVRRFLTVTPEDPAGKGYLLRVTAAGGLMVCVGSLLCALIFRVGPVLRGLGIELVRWDGRAASRLRTTWRALIEGVPLALAFLACAGSRNGTLGTAWIPQHASLLMACGVIFAALSLLPRRSLADRLSGTWQVPR